mmetsp:Transcript_6733/g.27471  ORF Transcript_6733/g.27471 Transcript_6733/m.27471 type:complete len:295 (+) Transcript_6733:25-909(+)
MLRVPPERMTQSLIELELFGVLLALGLVSVLEVLREDHVSVLAHRCEARRLADSGDVGGAQLVWTRHVILEVDLVAEVHLGGTHLEDQTLLAAVRRGELDLAVEAAWTQQRWVQRVGTVRRHNHLHIHRLVEAVHLVQQLHEDTLHLTVGSSLCVEARGSDGIHLIHEDDRRRVLLGEPEHIAHHSRPLAKVLLHELRAHHANESGGGVVCDGLGEHCLPRAGRSVEQHAARRVDADLPVEIAIGERQLDGLFDLLLLDVHAADVRVRDVRTLVRGHERDARIGLGRQHVHQCI